MSLLLVAFLVGLVPLRWWGGRWSRVRDLELRGEALLLAAAATQVTVALVDPLPSGVAAAGHVASYVLLLWFLVRNRRRAGVPVLLVGTLLNAVVIAANGGVMPASPGAARTAAVPRSAGERPGGFANSRPIDDAHLAVLGDVFAVPEALPLSNTFSVGDVLLVVGGWWVIHSAAGSRPFGRRPGVDGDADRSTPDRGVPVP